MDIKKNIEQYGWHFIFVFDPDGEKENFSYTVGFEETYKFPEIIIFGLNKDSAHGICTDIADDLAKGKTYPLNTKIADVIGGDYKVLFKEVLPEKFDGYLNGCLSYYKKPFRACVMFWPDKDGMFPFEYGYKSKAQNEALQIV